VNAKQRGCPGVQMRKNMDDRKYYIYIATNKNNTVLYTGVTKSLIRREKEHKNKINKNSFTAKYNINKIVYYEIFDYIQNAITREKQIKNLVRKKKINLIEKENIEWNDIMKNI
jgi:putative endonuclease